MNDLISRSKLIEHLNACLAESVGKTPITDAVLVAIECAVEEMPGVDAVPVVRCKDCRYWEVIETLIGTDCVCTEQGDMNVHKDEEDFCSWGERRADA